MKCVMIVDPTLPIGIIANTTAALGVSLASVKEGLIGPSIIDGDHNKHAGITQVPIPILSMASEDLKKLYKKVIMDHDEDIFHIGFSDIAQKSINYDDYISKLTVAKNDKINYWGICLYGPKKKINKLTGSLKMLK